MLLEAKIIPLPVYGSASLVLWLFNSRAFQFQGALRFAACRHDTLA